MFKKLSKKAQTTAEYAILIALVVGAVVAMQVYIKRGIQGRVKDAVDHVGSTDTVGGSSMTFSATQYEPYYNNSTATTDQRVTDNETLGDNLTVSRDSTTRTDAVQSQTIGWEIK